MRALSKIQDGKMGYKTVQNKTANQPHERFRLHFKNLKISLNILVKGKGEKMGQTKGKGVV